MTSEHRLELVRSDKARVVTNDGRLELDGERDGLFFVRVTCTGCDTEPMLVAVPRVFTTDYVLGLPEVGRYFHGPDAA